MLSEAKKLAAGRETEGMADAMKSLLVVFLLCSMALAAEKPYADLPITITSAAVARGILRIEARDKNNILKVNLVS
jgi:hypothetical protein